MEKKFEFKPTQFVLVRDSEDDVWSLDFFSHYNQDGDPITSGANSWVEVIPYEGNEKLLGTWDAYVEPYGPKDGDFVAIKVYEGIVKGANLWICIFKSISDAIDAYAGLGLDGDLVNKGNNVSYNKDWMKHIRPATEEEKQLLLSKLHEKGKDWNAEKKEIVDLKWKPKEGGDYYYPKFICGEFRSGRARWIDTDLDCLCLLGKGYIFRTDEEATALCDKLNEAIKNVK